MEDVKRWRDRLNILVLVLPGQWLTLMVVYWLRFYTPFRPFNFNVNFPPPAVFLLGCLAAFIPVFLPKGYFFPRSFEKGRFYPRLGLRWFRYFATDGDLVNQILRRLQPTYRVIVNRESLQNHLEGTYSNERWHLAFFIAGTLTAIHALTTQQYIIGSLLILTNLVFNLFPIFHQRYKRARLRRFAAKDESYPK